MSAAVKTCPSCGNEFEASRAAYCSPACKQRAHRLRGMANRNANRNASAVTVAAPVAGGRTDEAQRVLTALDAELKGNGDQLGQSLRWTAAECALLDLIGDAIDRRVGLQKMYEDADGDDAMAKARLAGEIRLIEAHLARLLKQVRTDLPAPPSRRSEKARRAAYARWDRR